MHTTGTPSGRVAAIVLAAGSSSRMGRSKLTLPFGESTVIGSTLRRVRDSSVDDVVVVVGHHEEAVRGTLESDVVVARNPDPSRGNASSLAVGLAAHADAGAAVVVPGDMPLISSEAIDRVVEAWRGGACVAALVDYSDGAGHPVLIDRSMFDVVAELHAPKALWRLIEGLDPEVVRRVALDRPKPVDVNREADYRLALQQLG